MAENVALRHDVAGVLLLPRKIDATLVSVNRPDFSPSLSMPGMAVSVDVLIVPNLGLAFSLSPPPPLNIHPFLLSSSSQR